MPACAGLLRANCECGLEAVHVGHLNVHQHQVERLRLGGRNCFAAVVGHDDLMSAALKQGDRQFLIVEAVFGQQNPQAHLFDGARGGLGGGLCCRGQSAF